MINGEEPIDLERSREEISDIISAMVTGKNSVNIVNLPNDGQIRDLPTGAVVETYGAISGLGASGVAFGDLPAPIAALVHPHVINQEMIVEAALTGDKDLAFQAFLNDPLISHHPEARNIFEEMFEAQSRFLPQFGESSGLRASHR